MDYIVYTDGGCHNEGGEKHGIGASAWLIPCYGDDNIVDVYTQYYENTTNNRTEMLAILNAISTLSDRDDRVNMHIISDSGYVVKGYTDPSYLEKWQRNGWKTSTKKPVLNIDLWNEFIRSSWHTGLEFEFELIKGHNKDDNKLHAFWNDICDMACTLTMESYKSKGMQIHFSYNVKDKTFTYVNVTIKEDLNEH